MSSQRRKDRSWVVAIAAGLWGLDGLLRQPLAADMNPATLVLWEHIIIVAVLVPFLPAALGAFVRCSWRDRVAIVIVGTGASAIATALFTQAFRAASATGDFVTPLVLQKLQPLFAITLAAILLGERPSGRFAAYAVPALVGAWFLTFESPLDVRASALQAALFATGAALLWAGGTVLGRMVSPAVGPRDLTALRFVWGLPAALAVAGLIGAPLTPGWANGPGLVLLALVPGLFALALYYLGLRHTAASRATVAELAFPATAAVVGVGFLDAQLGWSQWAGFALVVASITALSLREQRASTDTVSDPVQALVDQAAVRTPAPAPRRRSGNPEVDI